MKQIDPIITIAASRQGLGASCWEIGERGVIDWVLLEGGEGGLSSVGHYLGCGFL